MEYRTGTYVAFDGQGISDPCKSDYKYYSTIKAWNVNKQIDFKYVDSHEKTYSVKDTSTKETLHERIQERMRLSKNMLVILSKETRFTGSELSFEIEKAVDTYKLPLIIAYTEVTSINSLTEVGNMWPKALLERYINGTVNAIHIPFKKELIFDCIEKYTVNGIKPKGNVIKNF